MNAPRSTEPGVPFGAYRLVSRLGVGGMAEVYLAVRDGPMGFRKELAIKRIKGDFGSDTRLRALVNEAHLGGSLRHPNVVDTYEFGSVGGEHFIAMEYVQGLTVSALVAGAAVRGVRLPVGAILDIGQQVCNGLEYLHEVRSETGRPLGLVHRDLKPANVIVSAAGQAKIMDFGIARYAEAVFRTATADAFRGTLLYMSPEQIGDPRNLDHRSDLFSMGAILFEALTGEELINIPDPRAAMFMISNGTFRDRLSLLDDVLPAAAKIVDRCTRLDREERYASAEELGNELRALRDEVGGVDARNLMRLLSAYRAGDRTYEEVPGVWSQVGEDPTWASFVDALTGDAQQEQDPYRAPTPAELQGASLEGSSGQPTPWPAGLGAGELAGLSEVSQLPTSSWREPDDTAPSPPTRHRRWFLGAAVLGVGAAALAVSLVRPWEQTARTADPGSPAPASTAAAGEPAPTPASVPAADAPLADEDVSTPPPAVEHSPAAATAPPPAVEPSGPQPTTAAVPEAATAAIQAVEVAPVPVFVNTVPWSRWTLGGDAEGAGAHTPYRAELPPGTYHFTVTEPDSGESHRLSITIPEGSGPVSRCWSFLDDEPC